VQLVFYNMAVLKINLDF